MDKDKPAAPTSALKLTLLAQQVRAQAASILAADPIAIVGLACRVPGGGNSPEALWDLLRDGVDAVREVPADRWDANAWYDADASAPAKSNTRHAGFIDCIDGFDADYFGVLPREADRMDPQQRLFLEVALEALDDAGLSRDALKGSRTGVFIASYHNDYAQLQYNDLEAVDARTLTGTLHSVLANRLSYLLDLHGPSLSIDTACSSSLVAVHLACQSLRYGESDVAVAGGVSLILTPDLMVSMSKVGFMSPEGRCRTFDEHANGFGRGEGCGLVVLKRLSDAIAAGDRVLAVVRGSAVNQDGHSTLLAAPHGPAQEALIREALSNAQLEPGRIGYVEAHGTGTALGDPIEVEAIAATLGRVAAGPCFLGSAKANLGHLEAAAGVTGLIKTVLSLQHEAIAPQIHFTGLNPHISLAGTRLCVPTKLTPWPAGAVPRCAAVSSFGVGGTNAHVIIEEAPRLPEEAASVEAGRQILTLSAQSAPALAELTRNWSGFLEKTSASLEDICFTAAQRRTHYDHRLALTTRSKQELLSRLNGHIQGSGSGIAVGSRSPAAAPRVAFVFSGQGPQWYAMGRELLAVEPVFRDALTECAAALAKVCGWSLLEELARSEQDSRLDQTEVAQPALFAIQVALAALWKSWGVAPCAVVGHSVGEIAALHVAGVLDLPVAARVVWHRGHLMQQATGLGQMASVGLAEAQATELVRRFGDRLSVAAVNSPRSTVLSGESTALAEALAELDRRSISYRMLPVKYAFHSAQMAPFERRLSAELQGVQARPPAIPFYSTVSGDRADDLSFDAAYFGRNVRAPVRFAAAISALVRDGCDVFLEIGPHPVLASAIAECVDDLQPAATILASLRRSQPERETLLNACAGLYAAGCDLDWAAVQASEGHITTLPAYPWQRKRHWLRNRPASADAPARDPQGHPLLGAQLQLAGVEQQIYPADLTAGREWLAHHRIFGHTLIPAAVILELLMSAAARALCTDHPELQGFALHRPSVLAEKCASRWQIVCKPVGGGRVEVSLHESCEQGWRTVASAVATGQMIEACRGVLASTPYDPLSVDAVYQRFNALGVDFGESFRGLRMIERSDGQARGVLELPSLLAADHDRYAVHPVLLDAALQLCSLAVATGPNGELPTQVFLPLGVERVTLQRGSYSRLLATALVKATAEGGGISADITLTTENGTPVGLLEAVALAPASAAQLAALDAAVPRSATDLSYEVRWRAAPASEKVASGSARVSRTWLILADSTGIADALMARLSAAGDVCHRVNTGHAFARLSAASWTIDPTNPEHYAQLLAAPELSANGKPRTVLHCWSLDVAAQTDDDYSTGSVLHLTQALARASGVVAGLWLVTSGARVVTGRESAQTLRPRSAGLWGLSGVIALEHPELHVRVVDLDPAGAAGACAEALLAEFPAPNASPRVALRDGTRWVPELQRYESSQPPTRLEVAQPGTLESLVARVFRRAPLRPGQVRLQVLAAGLNFRDVLLTLGMYPGDGIALGAECAGVVIETAPGVSGFKAGDRVYGYVTGSLGTEAVASAANVARLPSGVEVESAAGLAVAYLTAHYGLYGLARLERGQRVLIHAAAGGVGLAAVELARRRGADIYATAGSDQKRDYLRRLGVQHVFDSRSLAFAEQVMAASGGRGVDVVLNSLSGDFIPASLRTLAPNGCFLELGKRDVWSSDAVAKARPDARYFVYDLGSQADRDPALLPPLFADLSAGLSDGSLRPLPVKVFELGAASEAMRYMAQARHIGKIVLRVARDAATGAPGSSGARIDGTGTYLITGGLGALGLETARWLVGEGARHLVLVGRHLPGVEAARTLQALEQLGARIQCFAVDVADREAMTTLLGKVRADGSPLRGVIHAAGVLRDSVLLRQNWEEAREVLRGKAHGAWLLHELTAADALDFFVLYSAAGALLGASGQGLYAAANAQLDALAQMRHQAGRPALSVAWGAWAGGGMAAAAAADGRDVWTQRGLRKLTAASGFGELSRLLRDGVATAAVISIDWSAFLEQLPAGADRQFFAGVAQVGTRTAAASIPICERLRALPAGERRQGLLDHLRTQALQVLGLDPAYPLDARAPLKDAGLDSLMAVELRNTLNRAAPQPLPATVLFDYPTLEALAGYLLRKWDLEPVAVPDVPPGTQAGVAAALDNLSNEEAEAMLRAELDELEAERAS